RERLLKTMVVAIAAVYRISADGRERNFRSDTARVARNAHHLAIASAATVSVTGGLPLVAAVLATLRLIRKPTLCVKRLLVLAENEFLAAVGTVEALVVEGIHGPLSPKDCCLLNVAAAQSTCGVPRLHPRVETMGVRRTRDDQPPSDSRIQRGPRTRFCCSESPLSCIR